MKEFSAPLDNKDFDELEKILQKYNADKLINDCASLDGFLAAIASGPQMIMPNIWVEAIFENENHTWENEEEYNLFFNLSARHMNSILYVLIYDEDKFKTMHHIIQSDNQEVPEMSSWCKAYEFGLSLCEDSHFVTAEGMDENLAIIHIFSDDTLKAKVYELPFQNALDLIYRVRPAIINLHKYWYQKRLSTKPQKTPDGKDSPVTDFRLAGEVNCPCGSNKEFQKCCGSSKTP